MAFLVKHSEILGVWREPKSLASIKRRSNPLAYFTALWLAVPSNQSVPCGCADGLRFDSVRSVGPHRNHCSGWASEVLDLQRLPCYRVRAAIHPPRLRICILAETTHRVMSMQMRPGHYLLHKMIALISSQNGTGLQRKSTGAQEMIN